MPNSDSPPPALTENLGPFALGTGIATLAISGPFMAVAIGLIEPTEPAHWALRVFLFLFTLPFVATGGALAVGGVVVLVDAAVPGDAPTLLRAPAYLLRQATRPRHLLAALPAALVVAQYYVVSRHGVGWFGIGPEFLERGILLEFIAIHATGFLGVLTLLPVTGRLRIARFAGMAVLFAFYLLIASGQGWDAALFLAYLMAIKLGPFALAPPDLHTGATLGLRWGFQTAVFLSVFSFFGGFDSLRAGAVYWTLITAAELLGMTEVELFQKANAET